MKAAKVEMGVGSQEPGARRKESEGRSQKKCFYKYEMLPYLLYSPLNPPLESLVKNPTNIDGDLRKEID